MSEIKIGITAMGSISPLGIKEDLIWENYLNTSTLLQYKDNELGGYLFDSAALNTFIKENKLETLDKSVCLAIFSAEQLMKKLPFSDKENIGVNIGSSRGATETMEMAYDAYTKTKKVPLLTSPISTLGNVSSEVGQFLALNGPVFSHSMTCSSASFALLNALAWIKSGMAEKMIVGGTEAPLTGFTLAQMKALKIYSTRTTETYPSLAGDLTKKQNTLVLGEGAALFCVEKNPSEENTLAWINGFGYACERISHPVSISNEADNLQKSMEMALYSFSKKEIDVIITHTPGTVKGDQAEYQAIEKVFGKTIPKLTNNKWKIGHTFGASFALSLEMALLMIKNQYYIPTPFSGEKPQPMQINHIMVSSMGFGGNAVSVLVSKN